MFTAGNDGDIEVVAERTDCRITPVIGVIPHSSQTAEVGGAADTDHGIHQSDFRLLAGVVITDLHGKVKGILHGRKEAVVHRIVIRIPQVNVSHSGIVLIRTGIIGPVCDLHPVVVLIHRMDFRFAAVTTPVQINGTEIVQVIDLVVEGNAIGNVHIIRTEDTRVVGNDHFQLAAVAFRRVCQCKGVITFPGHSSLSGAAAQDRCGGVVGTAFGLVQFRDPQCGVAGKDAAGLVCTVNIGYTVSHHLE